MGIQFFNPENTWSFKPIAFEQNVILLIIYLIQSFCSSLDISKFNVIYNSNLRFSERLYASLDVDLCRVRLHEPLEVIVQNPLLYVRDLVPKPCFQALSKLDQVNARRLLH